tara:strand:- start:1044 stop:1463 length:420 start_codon:yes stop_codon:yes gene_type:complete
MKEYLQITPEMGTLLASGMGGAVRPSWVRPDGNMEFANILVKCFPSFLTEEEPELKVGKFLHFMWTEEPSELANKSHWEDRWLFHWPHVGGYFVLSYEGNKFRNKLVSITWRGYKAVVNEGKLDTTRLGECLEDKIGAA